MGRRSGRRMMIDESRVSLVMVGTSSDVKSYANAFLDRSKKGEGESIH